MSTETPQYARHLPTEGTYNFRDVGGYPTADGGAVRWRMLFRSDSLHALTDSGRQALVDLGIRNSVDLRSEREVLEHPNPLAWDPRISHFYLPIEGGLQAPTEPIRSLGEFFVWRLENAKPSFLLVLETLGRRGFYPAVVNCNVGKDRTGLVVALLLGLLGVSKKVVVEDYVLSGQHAAKLLDQLTPPIGTAWILECSPDEMEQALDHLDHRYGGAAGYVREIGLSDDAIEAIRSALVEAGR